MSLLHEFKIPVMTRSPTLDRNVPADVQSYISPKVWNMFASEYDTVVQTASRRLRKAHLLAFLAIFPVWALGLMGIILTAWTETREEYYNEQTESYETRKEYDENILLYIGFPLSFLVTALTVIYLLRLRWAAFVQPMEALVEKFNGEWPARFGVRLNLRHTGGKRKRAFMQIYSTVALAAAVPVGGDAPAFMTIKAAPPLSTA